MRITVSELRRRLLALLAHLPLPSKTPAGFRLKDGPLLRGNGKIGLNYDELRNPHDVLWD